MDFSRYEVTETQVGEMVVQVFRRPVSHGDTQRWWYDVRWRGWTLWTNIVPDTAAAGVTRDEVEAKALQTAEQLGRVVGTVGRIIQASCRATDPDFGDRAAPTWTAVPDQIEEPRA